MATTQNTTEAPKKPVRQIKTAGAKPQIKQPAPPKAAAAPAKAPAPKVNAHVEAGLDVGAYEGISSMINANRKVQIMQSVQPKATGDLSGRQKTSLYALRRAYQTKPFPAKGFDNGILAALAAAGLISFKGGITEQINGHDYLLDGATPVHVTITAAGQSFGKP